MLEEDGFRWLFTLRLAFVLYNSEILCKLEFVGLKHLSNLGFLRLFQLGKHLD